MTGDLQFLAPKLPAAIATGAGLAGSAAYSISFNNTIGLGSILVAALVVIAAGVFTLRSNLKRFWKDLADERGEQVKVLEAKLEEKAQELVDAQVFHTEQMAAFAEEQREVRHELKTKVGLLENKLKLEEAKHDLTTVIVRLDGLEHTIDARSPMFEHIADGIDEQSKLLTEIRDQLTVRPLMKGA